MRNGRRKAKRPTQKKEKKQIKTMDVILVIVGISLLAFTVCMIKTFREYGAIPDTLCTCVFGALAGECGIMGWIKTCKERRRDRRWEIQDRQEAKDEAERSRTENGQEGTYGTYGQDE